MITEATCLRCEMVVEPIFYRESGGLCGYCLADDALLPLTRLTYTRHLDNRVEAGEITAEEAAEAWKEHHADDYHD